MKIDFDKPSRRKDGHIGATTRLRTDHGHYEFVTHGFSSDQVVAKIEAAEAHDAKKQSRLDGFRVMQGAEFQVGSATYRLADCTVRDVGEFGGDVELYVNVTPKVGGFPIRKRYPNMDAVPDDQGILQMVTARLPVADDMNAAHEEFTRKVNDKVKKKERP